MNQASILLYHNIGSPAKGSKMTELYVTPRQFSWQMHYLKIAGFKVVSMDTLLDYVQGKNLNKKLISLSFDDGFQDFPENAFPLLNYYHYPATVYLVTEAMGKWNFWDEALLRIKKPVMDWETVQQLKDKDISFGSHGVTHPFLDRISPEEMDREIRESKKIIEEKLQLPCPHFCYPYGNYNEQVLKIVRNSGYQTAVTTKRGFLHPGDDPFVLKRIPVKYSTDIFSFIYKLQSNYEVRKGRRK